MRDITNEIQGAVARLADLQIVAEFAESASATLYADGIGVLLGNLAEQAVASLFSGKVMGGGPK